jgi:uncharacterized protein YbaR (Trm112 family)
MSQRIDALTPVLICPQCAGQLHLGLDELVCQACRLGYPIRDGVPVLVIDQAVPQPFESNDADFERLIAEGVNAPFAGWDWAWLEGRRTVAYTPYDLVPLYAERARALVAAASAVLDLGTGGGEQLSQFGPFPDLAVATEAYPPNVRLAAERLGPYGVRVVWTDGNTHNSRGPQARNRWPQRRLPFADATFDLVLARRSAFSPREVARILVPDGKLLTLNGHTEWRGETLADALGASPPEWTIPGQDWPVGHSLFEAGFGIDQWLEGSTRTTYHDIGAVLYSLLHVPWSVPGFRLERYRARLYQLHQRMQREGGFSTTSSGYLVEAVVSRL